MVNRVQKPSYQAGSHLEFSDSHKSPSLQPGLDADFQPATSNNWLHGTFASHPAAPGSNPSIPEIF